jgi:hypothetical protein
MMRSGLIVLNLILDDEISNIFRVFDEGPSVNIRIPLCFHNMAPVMSDEVD